MECGLALCKAYFCCVHWNLCMLLPKNKHTFLLNFQQPVCDLVFTAPLNVQQVLVSGGRVMSSQDPRSVISQPRNQDWELRREILPRSKQRETHSEPGSVTTSNCCTWPAWTVGQTCRHWWIWMFFHRMRGRKTQLKVAKHVKGSQSGSFLQTWPGFTSYCQVEPETPGLLHSTTKVRHL